MLHCLLHFFVATEKLLLHVVDLLEQLLLLALLFLLGFLLDFQLGKQLLTFLLRDGCLGLQLGPLLFELLANLLLVFLEGVL